MGYSHQQPSQNSSLLPQGILYLSLQCKHILGITERMLAYPSCFCMYSANVHIFEPTKRLRNITTSTFKICYSCFPSSHKQYTIICDQNWNKIYAFSMQDYWRRLPGVLRLSLQAFCFACTIIHYLWAETTCHMSAVPRFPWAQAPNIMRLPAKPAANSLHPKLSRAQCSQLFSPTSNEVFCRDVSPNPLPPFRFMDMIYSGAGTVLHWRVLLPFSFLSR